MSESMLFPFIIAGSVALAYVVGLAVGRASERSANSGNRHEYSSTNAYGITFVCSSALMADPAVREAIATTIDNAIKAGHPVSGTIRSLKR